MKRTKEAARKRLLTPISDAKWARRPKLTDDELRAVLREAARQWREMERHAHGAPLPSGRYL